MANDAPSSSFWDNIKTVMTALGDFSDAMNGWDEGKNLEDDLKEAKDRAESVATAIDTAMAEKQALIENHTGKPETATYLGKLKKANNKISRETAEFEAAQKELVAAADKVQTRLQTTKVVPDTDDTSSTGSPPQSPTVSDGADVAEPAGSPSLETMHSFGTVGICFKCVRVHLRSLSDHNCNYKLQVRFPLCEVSSSREQVTDTAYFLHLEACILDTSLQLQFWVTSTGGIVTDGSLYSIPLDHENDLERMTHLSCRITHRVQKTQSWFSWGISSQAQCDVEFIGPETPSTSFEAQQAATEINKSTRILHLKHPSECRIVSQVQDPKITDLSTVEKKETDTKNQFDTQLLAHQTHATNTPKLFKESVLGGFKGVTGGSVGRIVQSPQFHISFPVQVSAGKVLTVSYSQITKRLFLFPHVCGWGSTSAYSIKN